MRSCYLGISSCDLVSSESGRVRGQVREQLGQHECSRKRNELFVSTLHTRHFEIVVSDCRSLSKVRTARGLGRRGALVNVSGRRNPDDKERSVCVRA